MAIPRHRDWRDEWKSSDWWELFALQWLSVGCAMEASADFRSRRAFEDGWSRIADARNMLVSILDELDETKSERETIQARESLGPAIDFLDGQIAELRAAHRIRAFDDEKNMTPKGFDRVVLRKLLEHGVTPSQYAVLRNHRLAGDRNRIHESSDRVRATQERAILRGYYERSLVACLELFEDAGCGCDVFVPLGDVFVDRNGARWLSRWPTPMHLAREVYRLTELIACLSPQSDS